MLNPHEVFEYDASTAEEQKEFELIPGNLVLAGVLEIRGAGAGPDGMQKLSADGTCIGLDTCTHITTEGPYKGRKIYRYLVTQGTSEGQQTAAEIAKASIKAMIQSAFGFHPNDMTPETLAKIKAVTAGGRFHNLNGISYWFRTGIAPAKNGYQAKNTVGFVIVPGVAGWSQLQQTPAVAPLPTPTFAAQQQGAAPPSGKPAWAR